MGFARELSVQTFFAVRLYIYIVGGALQSTFDTAVLLLYFISASSRTVKTTALYIQKYDISTEYDVRSALESAAHRLTLLYIVLQVRQAGSSMQHVVWICVCVFRLLI